MDGGSNTGLYGGGKVYVAGGRRDAPAGCGRVYAEVDLDAIAQNMEAMKRNLPTGTMMYAVVKADAYGHGSAAVAGKLETVDYVCGYAVATAEEALYLRRAGIRKPVLVLGYTFPDCHEMMVREEIRTTVFRMDTVDSLEAAARAAGKPAKVHIKVDTGMNRIGITPDRKGLAFVEALTGSGRIEIEGIFTHFARADEADKTSAGKQLGTFKEFLHMIKKELSLEIPIKHCSNSAAILEMPQAGMDAVRAGIAMYGLPPSDEVSGRNLRLRPALSLYSHIVYIKTIAAGESVSYGGTFTAAEPMRVATVPVGYGDGYPRDLSNRGYCLLHQKKAPILGRVCMDQFMVDVSDIPEASEGDRVVLLGYDETEGIDTRDLEEMSGRYHYELLCGLGGRIPRIYIGGRHAGMPEAGPAPD